MFQPNRFLLRGWGGKSLPFLFLNIIILLNSFLMSSCSNPRVEVGKVTITVQEPIKTANNGENS